MPTQYYSDALKLGQREFRACVGRGEHPYLPVLDDFISAERQARGTDLGLVSVPMELVVGTVNSARTNAFARNFMPLMEEDSEFAAKWKALCKAHLDVGIRDPIKAYEFMNRYYVQEGNKRCSVLKYFGADRVEANVIRVLPERNGSREVELYYAFLDFYQCSKVNFIEFSKPGSYALLQQLMGKAPGEPWTDDERRDFSAACYYFRRAYEAMGGKRLRSTVGDAMLAYMKVYGYQSLRRAGEGEIKRLVSRVWEEITLQQEPAPIDVKLAPSEEKESGGGLLSKVLPRAKPEVLKVAFVNDKTPETSGWTYGHELGRQYVQNVFGEEIETTAYFRADDADPLALIETAIGEGNTVVFTTSPRLLPASLRAAVDHPKALILNCSLNKSHRYIRSYYARMYEAKFIIGAIAGSLAGDEPIGYICDYPIFGQVAGINAFALGAQAVNPRAKVYLEWYALGGAAAAAQRLLDRGVRLISSMDMAKLEDRLSRNYGLFLMEEGKQTGLAMPVWRWGVYYEAMLRQIRSKALQNEYAGSSKALNYYWGLSAGVVEVMFSEKLPNGAKKLATLLRSGICAGSCDPFQGPITAQDGGVVIGEEQHLELDQIMSMDWLAENVVGTIPTYEELDEIGQATVRIMGVAPSTPDKNEAQA